MNGTIFEKKILNIKYVLVFSVQLLSETFLILRKFSEILSKFCIGHHVKYPLFVSDFNKTLIFWAYFLKILIFKISWQSVHLEPYFSVRTGRRRDMTKLIFAFHNYANAPKKVNILPLSLCDDSHYLSHTFFWGVSKVFTEEVWNSLSRIFFRQARMCALGRSPYALASEWNLYFNKMAKQLRITLVHLNVYQDIAPCQGAGRNSCNLVPTTYTLSDQNF